jgi:hypothetical protein
MGADTLLVPLDVSSPSSNKELQMKKPTLEKCLARLLLIS